MEEAGRERADKPLADEDDGRWDVEFGDGVEVRLGEKEAGRARTEEGDVSGGEGDEDGMHSW